MKKNAESGAENLQKLAGDLNEICGLMSELSMVLQGGGIVSARDIEPSIAKAVPKLRRAVDALKAASATKRERATDSKGGPLLM